VETPICDQTMNPAPRKLRVSTDLRFIIALTTVWLGPWATITAAAWVGGGEPTESPLDFVNPTRVAALLHARAGAQSLWRFVGAMRPSSVPVFWLSLTLLTLLLATFLIC